MTSLRPAVAQDLTAIENLVAAAYAPHAAQMGQKPGPMLDDYAKIIADHSVFVAAASTQIVGLLVLIEQDEFLLLDNVAVAPQAQGTGLASQLMRHAEDFARTQGFTEIRLYTHETMTQNQAIYRRFGYSELYRVTEKGLNRVYFSKPISEVSNC